MKLWPLLLLSLLAPARAQTERPVLVVDWSVPTEHVAVQAWRPKLVRWLQHYTRLMQLQQWDTIWVSFVDLEDPTWLATTSVFGGKQQAQIAFDLEVVATESEPWRVVVHELLHIKTFAPHSLGLHLISLCPESEDREFVMNVMEGFVVELTRLPVWKEPPK